MTARWFDFSDRRLSRREFLALGRDVAGCLALSSIPVSAAHAGTFRPADYPFGLGVASGDPLEHAVVIWTRLDPFPVLGGHRVPIGWELSDSESFASIVKKGKAVASPELGGSVHVDVKGLRPGRDYFYRFHAGDHTSAVGRTRTAPRESDRPDLCRFAFISCQNYEHGFYTAFSHLAKEDVDFVIHLGDYIYEKHFAANPIVRNHEAGEVQTLDEYRARYALYRRDPELQAAHASCPWIVTTDDHEVANNYASAIAETDVAPDRFLLRRAAAYQAYYEFMPLRRSSMPHGPWMRIYRRLAFGDLIDFHVLDTRQYRTDQPCGDGRKPRCADALRADATMMGPAQEAWLYDGLRHSRARWNVLANQVMIAQSKQMVNEQATYSMDKWDGYVAPRDRLLRFLDTVRPSNPVVVTGDIHSNWVADLKVDFENPASRTVATELVGTSMTSGGDGSDGVFRGQSLNPHIKFFNGRRGYVRVAVSRERCTADYRVVPYVSKPGAPVETRASFVVENGHPGAVGA